MKATTRRLTGLLAGLAVATVLMASCGGSGTTDDTPQPPLDTTPTTTIAPADGTVMDFIASRPEYSILTSLVKDAGLDETLTTGPEFTLFAPTDTVFESMSSATLDGLRKDKEKLTELLLNHVWDVETMTIDMLDGAIELMSGKTVEVKIGESITVAGFPLSPVDMRVMNGVVHSIAGVIQ